MSRNGNAAYLSADRKAKRARRIRTAIQYVLAIAVLLIVVFPLYWMLISSVKSQEEILLLKHLLAASQGELEAPRLREEYRERLEQWIDRLLRHHGFRT